jgi:YbbR domain-containing protein
MERHMSSENFSLRVTADSSDLRNQGQRARTDWLEVTRGLSAANFVGNVPQANRISVTKIGLKDSMVELRLRWRGVQATVKPDLIGIDQIPQGFQLVQPVRVNPKEVYLVGEQDVLDALPRDPESGRAVVMTQPVSLFERTQSGLEPVELILPAGLEVLDRPSPAMVEVVLEIQQLQTIRDIRGIPVGFAPLNPESVAVNYSPETVTVKVAGPQALLRELTAQSFTVNFVRPSEELPGTSREVALQVRLADTVPSEIRQRVVIRSFEPTAITVNYQDR